MCGFSVEKKRRRKVIRFEMDELNDTKRERECGRGECGIKSLGNYCQEWKNKGAYVRDLDHQTWHTSMDVWSWWVENDGERNELSKWLLRKQMTDTKRIRKILCHLFDDSKADENARDESSFNPCFAANNPIKLSLISISMQSQPGSFIDKLAFSLTKLRSNLMGAWLGHLLSEKRLSFIFTPKAKTINHFYNWFQ